MKYYVWKYEYGILGNKKPLPQVPVVEINLLDEANRNKQRLLGVHTLDEVFESKENAEHYCEEQTKVTGMAYYIVVEDGTEWMEHAFV